MHEHQIIGVGPTATLNLRVSAATLARVVFINPNNGEQMLTLEHKATVLPRERGQRVVVKAQPFGGAIRIFNLTYLQLLIGLFHFDSERSRSEQDLRIFIQMSDWKSVKDFCLKSFTQEKDVNLESDPRRELIEEFWDTLGVELKPDQYIVKPIEIVVENEPSQTKNVNVAGSPTVRIYRIFEANILDPTLCLRMIKNSNEHSRAILREKAMDDAQKGKSGRANAMLVVSLKKLCDAYLELEPVVRDMPLTYQGALLDTNVPAILEGVSVPKYTHF